MATFISAFIKSALFFSILSFMFWCFFPQMFDSFIFHLSDYFLRFSMFGRVSTLEAMRSFFSTLISPTIIASIVSFIVGNIFPKVLESFLSRMADFISHKLFDYFLSMPDSIVSWISEKANYFRSLEHTLKPLDEALKGLLALEEKVNAVEQNPNMRQKKEVTLWLQKVKDAETKVRALQEEIKGLHLRGFFSKINFNSRYQCGKKVANLKQEMTKLKDEGGNIKDELAERTPAASAIRLATERIMASKGQQSTLDEVWGCLRGEPAVEIIGLYGPGGVGKTTLLKQINNKFCDEYNGFEVVIWLVVSNNPSVEELREEVGRRLGFADDKSWKKKSVEEKK